MWFRSPSPNANSGDLQCAIQLLSISIKYQLGTGDDSTIPAQPLVELCQRWQIPRDFGQVLQRNCYCNHFVSERSWKAVEWQWTMNTWKRWTKKSQLFRDSTEESRWKALGVSGAIDDGGAACRCQLRADQKLYSPAQQNITRPYKGGVTVGRCPLNWMNFEIFADRVFQTTSSSCLSCLEVDAALRDSSLSDEDLPNIGMWAWFWAAKIHRVEPIKT